MGQHREAGFRSRAGRLAGLGAVVVLACGAEGCAPRCGSYEAQCGLSAYVDGEEYTFDRDDLWERCGPLMGATAFFDLLGDGRGYITFMANHADSDIDSAVARSLFFDITFANSSLVVGEELAIDGGEAGVYGVDSAPFTEGTIEVLSEHDVDCILNQQEYRLRWDLDWNWGETGHSSYHSEGRDWVPFNYDDETAAARCD
ncbi:MAG: hypothetical protein ABIO70_13490 [Pseudomonadota bacterium]